MNTANMGPPEKERPRNRHEPGPHQRNSTFRAPAYSTAHRQWVDALRRRRLASQRCVPLDCGCRDPWPCRCTEPPLTERQVDYWRDAVLHVLDTGCMPLLPLEARQALWRRGGADRVLAELLHDGCGGEAA